jgi:hypothetical protein
MRNFFGSLLLAASSLLCSPSSLGASVEEPGQASGQVNSPIEGIADNGEEAMQGRSGPVQKSVASGFYMEGAWQATWANNTATIKLDRIKNESSTRTTGTLRLELWAVSTIPARAGAFTGYRLATTGTLAGLAPRKQYMDVSGSGAMLSPPNGSYWLLLVLTEYDPQCTAQADRYCQQDNIPADTKTTFGNPAPAANHGNFSDLWWNASESGWGVTITHHPSEVAFITWFTYDSAGHPKWYVAPGCHIVSNYCSDTLYETSGPPFGSPFNSAIVNSKPVGTISFNFTSLNAGVMSYNVGGITGSKVLARQPF